MMIPACFRSTVFLLLSASLFAGAAPGTVYYLSSDGDDSRPGDRDAPWRSIERANSELGPGDTLVFLPGEYAGTIDPVRDGRHGAPIVFRAEEPGSVRIVPEGSRPLIRLRGRGHVTFENLVLDGESEAVWVDAVDCRYLVLKNCALVNAARQMSIDRSSDVWLLDNVFVSNRPRGDMVHLVDSSRVVVEGNSFAKNGHCPLRVQGGVHIVIRSNVFRNNWGRNYEFWASGRLLIEGNIITLARDSAGSADSRAKNLYDDSIFRYNRAFGNLHVPLNTGSYIWSGVTQTGFYRWPFRAVNSRFYHNTIADNLGTGWQFYGMNVSGNVFQNNIFYRNDWPGRGVQVHVADDLSKDNRFVTNLFSGTEPGTEVIRYGRSTFWTAEQANRETFEVGGFWSEFLGNIDADPGFRDRANRDYRLGEGSPAIDSGTPLAVAVGEGTGRALPVTDGYPFYDGFGIEGEVGDRIAVGSEENLARVERVELRYYQPALLHLDREVSWSDGMPVSLPWRGDAPDIGAYEFGPGHPDRIVAVARPSIVRAGEPVSFGLDTQGESLEGVLWDFEDGSFARTTNPVHTFETPGDYGVTVRATLSGGRRVVDSLFVTFEEEARGNGTAWVNVDFEDETFGTEWGYMFKFYRGPQTGVERQPRSDGRGTCMAIFYEEGRGNQNAAQIAPGLWDIEENPIVRFDYRIPEGVPVAIEMTTFGERGHPDRFIIGGTADRSTRGEDLDLFPLIGDDRWRTMEIDLRSLRERFPDLRHLRQFLFFTNWQEDAGQIFWMDNFSISPR